MKKINKKCLICPRLLTDPLIKHLVSTNSGTDGLFHVKGTGNSPPSMAGTWETNMDTETGREQGGMLLLGLISS